MRKKFFNKNSFTAIIFLAITLIVSFITMKNNFDEIKFTELESIDDTFSKHLSGFDSFIDIWAYSQRAIGAQLFDDAGYGVIIKDNTGKLHFPIARVDVQKEADAMSKLADELKELDIPLLYVQNPNKKLEGYTVFPKGGYNFSNENADAFISKIKADSIDVLDLRELVIEENLDRDSMFYKTDHHWTTTTAFWAFTRLVEYINSEYDMQIDPGGYFRNIDNYYEFTYKKCYLGSQGRRLSEKISGLDDYTFIYPAFITDYDIYNQNFSPDEPQNSGSFYNVIVNEPLLALDDATLNKHAVYFEWDYGNLIVKNKIIDNDIKILLIKDSFSLPFAAFMSTCVSEIHMIDVRDESAPIVSEYVREHDLDMVIVIYNTEVFGNNMFDFGE